MQELLVQLEVLLLLWVRHENNVLRPLFLIAATKELVHIDTHESPDLAKGLRDLCEIDIWLSSACDHILHLSSELLRIENDARITGEVLDLIDEPVERIPSLERLLVVGLGLGVSLCDLEFLQRVLRLVLPLFDANVVESLELW